MAFSRYPTTRINGGLITRFQYAEVQCVMEAFLVRFKVFLHFRLRDPKWHSRSMAHKHVILELVTDDVQDSF